MASDSNSDLELIVTLLKEECSNEEFQTVIQTLLRILRNVEQNPTEEKYRQLRKTNPSFAQKLWRFDGARQIMFALRWTELEDSLVLVDTGRVPSALQHLSIYTQQSTSASNQTSSWTQEELEKKEAVLEEAKRLRREQQRKDKEERERLSEQIKNDRQDSNARPGRDSHATQLTRHGMVGYKDVGVNLNRGGG